MRLYNKENEATLQDLRPHKHDIITLLSVGGHWITIEENLQVRTSSEIIVQESLPKDNQKCATSSV